MSKRKTVYVCMGCQQDYEKPTYCVDCERDAEPKSWLMWQFMNVEAALDMIPCLAAKHRGGQWCKSNGAAFQCAKCSGLRSARACIDELEKLEREAAPPRVPTCDEHGCPSCEECFVPMESPR